MLPKYRARQEGIRLRETRRLGSPILYHRHCVESSFGGADFGGFEEIGKRPSPVEVSLYIVKRCHHGATLVPPWCHLGATYGATYGATLVQPMVQPLVQLMVQPMVPLNFRD